METFTDLFFPSTLGDHAPSRDVMFPEGVWIVPKSSDFQQPQGLHFGFARGFHSGMVMPAAAEGAPRDPVVRGHGPPGRVVSVIQ